VPSSSRPDSGESKAAFALVLELSLTEDDPVSGTVRVVGRSAAMSFHGWIDLMSVINGLRAEAVQGS
jgi:hypothetical protein